MGEVSRGRLGTRLRRILLLLPYAIQHPGVTLDDLADRFGVPKQDLMDDLDLVFLCGLPGYGPGDLIDVSIDDDRVFIRMADYFGAPFRLTPAEAMALYVGGTLLLQLPEMDPADALRRAVDKLGRALGITGDDTAEIQILLEGGAPHHLETIRRGVQEQRPIRLEYRSASRAELSERDVDPWALVAAGGHWYLVGLDHLSGEERMFRLDRVKDAELGHGSIEVPSDFDPDRFSSGWTGSGTALEMSMEISPQASRWFGEYHPILEAEELPDGWTRVTLPVGSEKWGATLAVKMGPEARNLAPSEIEKAASELASRVAALYA